MPMQLSSPMDPALVSTLKAGETVLLSGVVYTARDAAHARMLQAIQAGKPLPVELAGQTIFYAGPTPTPPGRTSGAIGPTTSVRMDTFTPALLEKGLLAIIGKGDRGEAVKQAIVQNHAVYFTAPAGCAAVLSACIEHVEVVAYEDLGTESIKRLTVRDLPLMVAIDCQGNDIYELGPKAYLSDS
ncbi:MAG: fumarate hydratase C-terminal domain-containing protein [Firmicutes bacterium]|nr:fumarate hydratase C-terminal domain-containing protein [Bacillota bacterium]